MQSIIDNPRAALSAGLALTAAAAARLAIAAGADGLGLLAFLVRLVHVLAAMIWIGLMFFVNFVQLVALQDGRRAGARRSCTRPSCRAWPGGSGTPRPWRCVSGVLLLVLAGYLLPSLVYGTERLRAAGPAVLLWSGVIGALAMWMFVHMYIWPNMQVVLGMRPGDDAAKAAARARVILFARLNLVLIAAGRVRHGGGGAPLLTWRPAVAADAAATTPSSRLRAPASPTATLPRCWPRPPRARDLLALAAFSAASWPACRSPSRASRRWARSGCSGGAMRWRLPRRRAHRPSDRRCRARADAPPRSAARRSCSTSIDARAGRPRPAADARRRRARALSVEERRARLFALAAGVLASPSRGADAQAAAAACGQAYGLARLLLGLPHALSRGHLPLPQSRLDAGGREQSGTVGRRQRQQRRGACSRACCAEAREALATSRQHVANLPRQVRVALPSFGLGRDVSAGAGTAGPRRVARSGRDSAAHARVQDCRGALARSHLTPRGRRAGLRSCGEQIDADRCRPEHLPRAHAGRDARGRGDGRASDRVAGREPLPVLPRSGRHPGASRDLAQPVGDASAAIPCSRRSGR